MRDLSDRGWSFDVVCAPGAGSDSRSPDPLAPAIGPLEVFKVSRPGWPDQVVDALLTGLRHVRDAMRRAVGRSADHARSHLGPNRIDIWSPGDSVSLRTKVLKSLRSASEILSDRIWAARATRMAKRLLRSRTYGAVVVSSPPHFSQLVGLKVARLARVPWIADLRDPWIIALGELTPFVSPFARIVGERLERKVQRRATVLVHNTERAAQATKQELPGVTARRVAIPNGYDCLATIARPDAECFRVIYGGWIYPFMDVRKLLDACSRLRSRHDLGAESMRIEFVGSDPDFGGVGLVALAEERGLHGCVEVLGRMPRREALVRQQRAAVLAAFDYPHGVSVVMKFYDYAQMFGRMLLIAEPESALAQAAGKIGVGVQRASDPASLDRALDEAYTRWRANHWPEVNDPHGVHSRARRSAEMHALLEDTIGHSSRT